MLNNLVISSKVINLLVRWGLEMKGLWIIRSMTSHFEVSRLPKSSIVINLSLQIFVFRTYWGSFDKKRGLVFIR